MKLELTKGIETATNYITVVNTFPQRYKNNFTTSVNYQDNQEHPQSLNEHLEIQKDFQFGCHSTTFNANS